MKSSDAPPSPEKKVVGAYVMPYEEVLAVDKLADELNNEVSVMALGIDPSTYDWKLADLLL